MSTHNLSATLAIFPTTAKINAVGHLSIGDCDLVELATTYGTPLYVFDETTLRDKCREFQQEFTRRYPDTIVLYSCKALINLALVRIMAEEGMGLDVVSGGEIAIAHRAGFPMERVQFPGNNKGADELRLALDCGVGRVVVDNFHELELLQNIARERNTQVDILLRLSPGVDPHTHHHTTTGIIDSKFGFPITTGQAEEAVRIALHSSQLRLRGLHAHLGSPIFELEPYQEAIKVLLDFAAKMRERYGMKLEEISIGGGFAIQYVRHIPPPSVANYAEAIVSTLIEGLSHLDLGRPQLIIEPGRSIVGRAGVALYTVGASKDIPGVRKYVSVDGGMADNIRPALYGARYEALVANRPTDPPEERVTIAGKYCESGDVLIRDIDLPRLRPGDLIAVPAAGAYCLSMASNYNASLRPPIVLVRDGTARLIRRRETYEDLWRCDVT